MYNLVQHELFRPYVHGTVLTVAYQDPMPKNMNWSNVSNSKHQSRYGNANPAVVKRSA